ncbi:hypothetical protein M947_02015 [Sulfurimonas hongkongensis]|uniref:Spermatogenesis-associated protein 20-like TRX domain-containing protein n=1 Tax=Sulfurimonas hongkongensis TaxID=1172190 RepID=T0KUE2_9BACT|nr:DUF255 domain-containing protein [Sulfurimonas hongkongensis]EQB40604.1 hypothetical protein M947_02015 [Sulfurimonas hongkongensis]
MSSLRLLALCLALLCLTLEALDFKTYEEAKILQKKSKKLIMLEVMRSNCHFCSDMQRDVFDDKEMSLWIEERFIPVKVNLDTDSLPLGLKVSFTPSFFFIDIDDNIKKKIPGSWNIEDFKSLTKDLK